MEKKCYMCKLVKDSSLFYYNKRENEFRSYCKSCDTKSRREKREERTKDNPNKYKKKYPMNTKHPDYYKNLRLQYHFKITIEQYNEMLNNQKGCCKLCGRHHSDVKRALAVDHCHTTGKIRGLLCDNCNLSLGGFKDNIETLEKAIQYLKDNK